MVGEGVCSVIGTSDSMSLLSIVALKVASTEGASVLVLARKIIVEFERGLNERGREG